MKEGAFDLRHINGCYCKLTGFSIKDEPGTILGRVYKIKFAIQLNNSFKNSNQLPAILKDQV